MKRRVGIIGAMDDEIALYLDMLEQKHEKKYAGFTFNIGKLDGKDVVVVKSGVGKVNASVCTQLMISKLGISRAIFTGVAGALNPKLNVADIVVSHDSLQHDIDASGLGFEKGLIPFSSLKHFRASEELIGLALSAAKFHGLNAMRGRILTGDQFVNDKVKSEVLRREFGGDCIDMESAAVAHTCIINKVPHVIIRSISDKADHSAHVDFAEFCKNASKKSFKVVDRMVSEMELEHEMPRTIKAKVRTVPHWPKKGVMFRDITTLLKDKEGLNTTINLLEERYCCMNIDTIVGIESRGFIIGAILADRLKTGFVPIRKSGKLPAKIVATEYELEYRKDKIEIHEDAIKKGDKVLLVDDLIATGGTALAACGLIKKLKGEIVECAFVMDLPALGGKKKLEAAGYRVFNLIEFEGQ